jgi:hypothetical protein
VTPAANHVWAPELGVNGRPVKIERERLLDGVRSQLGAAALAA